MIVANSIKNMSTIQNVIRFQEDCFLFEEVGDGRLLKRAKKEAVSSRMATIKPDFLWTYATG